MFTRTITLCRHGESEGNADKSIYKVKPDYSLRLTNNGYNQAIRLGKEIREDFRYSTNKFAVYCSPFWRARDTLQGIKEGYQSCPAKISYFNSNEIPLDYVYEDSRLREQEWGGRVGTSFNYDIEKERDETGHYYFRFPNGESCADVENRISSFMNTLWRDIESKSPENVLIICHGMTMRVFLKRWLHLSVEEFERMKNPANCSRYILKRESKDEKFELDYDFGYAIHEKSLNLFKYEPFESTSA